MGIKPDERERRLWARIDVIGTCWIWTGNHFKAGYGQVKWDGVNRKVHQVVWELLVGPMPHGLEPDHLCRVRDCANPDHLEWVTHAENTSRARMARGTANGNGRKTHCPQEHEYTVENTRIGGRDGKRYCRTCHREDEARRAARRRQLAS